MKRKLIIWCLVFLVILSGAYNLFLSNRYRQLKSYFFKNDLDQIHYYLSNSILALSQLRILIDQDNLELNRLLGVEAYLTSGFKELGDFDTKYFGRYPNDSRKTETGLWIRSLGYILHWYQQYLRELAVQWNAGEEKDSLLQELKHVEDELTSFTELLFPERDPAITINMGPESVRLIVSDCIDNVDNDRRESLIEHLKLFIGNENINSLGK